MIDTSAIIEWVAVFPKGLATFLLAMIPLTELRLAIPVAVGQWLVNPFNAFGIAVLGNMIPFFPLYFGLGAVRRILESHAAWSVKFLDAQIDRSKKRVEKSYAKYGALALFLFTAIPLPLTGLYTATLAAVALKIPFKQALIGIMCGVVTAGVIVSLLTVTSAAFF